MIHDNRTGLIKILLQKELNILFFSAFLIMLNLFTLLNLLPLYVVHNGGSAFSAGIQNAIFNISAVALRFYFGPIADTKGRKLLLLMGSFVFATAPLFIWVSHSYWLQIFARIYYAIGLATFLSSASSAVADYTPVQYRGIMIGLYRSILSIALMLGPSLGLKLINTSGYDALFIFSSGICFISFILIFFLPADKRTAQEISNEPVAQTSIRLLLKKPVLLRAYAGVSIISLSSGILFAYLTMYALSKGFIGNPGVYFTIFAGVGALTTACSGYLSDHFGRERVIYPSFICLGLGLSLLSIFSLDRSYLFYFSAVFSGIGHSSALASLIAWIVDHADDKARATALSLQESAIDMSMAFGAFLFGMGTIRLEMSTLYLLLGLITIVLPFSFSRISASQKSDVSKQFG